MNILFLSTEKQFSQLAEALKNFGNLDKVARKGVRYHIVFVDERVLANVPSIHITKIILLMPSRETKRNKRLADWFLDNSPQGAVFFVGKWSLEEGVNFLSKFLREFLGLSGGGKKFHLGHSQGHSFNFKLGVSYPLAAFILLVWIISLPFVSLALSFLSLNIALSTDRPKALSVASFTATLSDTTFTTLTPLKFLPFVRNSMEVALLMRTRIIPATFELSSVKSALTSKGVLEFDFSKINFLVRESFFLRAKFTSLLPGFVAPYLSDWDSVNKLLLPFADSNEFMDKLLGRNKESRFMLVFQNSEEIRPTGGFIGSFALLGVQDGLLTGETFYDVYDADGALSGFVAPPEPIKKYLDEPAWKMRDANWDPSFMVSGKRLAWFLEKSLDERVDGIVFINLEVLKSLLELTGPLQINAIEESVESSNVGGVLHDEIRENFFPGSKRKKVIIEELYDKILDRVESFSVSEKIKLVNLVADAFEGRDIALVLLDSPFSSYSSRLSMDSLELPPCTSECSGIVQGIVEANVGVNKINRQIKRSITNDFKVGERSLVSSIKLTLTNQGNYTGSEDPTYKVYIRSLAPRGAIFKRVYTDGSLSSTDIAPEIDSVGGRVEAGVYIEVEENETKEITFNWEMERYLNPIYLVWRRQPGTVGDLTLTVDGVSIYNSTFAKDVFYLIK